MADQLILDLGKFDAGLYTVAQAIECFVPNRVWDQVRAGVNQVLYGGAGTGKTLIMKRLSWPAMLGSPAYLPGREFIAFYLNMRCLADLAPLFNEAVFPAAEEMRRTRLSMAACLGTLYLLQSVAETLEAAKYASKLNTSSTH